MADRLAGSSPFACALRERVRCGPPGEQPVLITGPSGAGKDYVAMLFAASAGSSCEIVDCRTGTPALVLPGTVHEIVTPRGLTDLMQSARASTVIFEQVSELDLRAQAWIVDALEQNRRASTPVQMIFTDIRTRALMKRLGAVVDRLLDAIGSDVIAIPPLCERAEDIVPLVGHFAERAAMARGVSVPMFTAAALHSLSTYPWPGNVRQLEHVVSQLIMFVNDGVVTRDDLRVLPRFDRVERLDVAVGASFYSAEKALILATLASCRGSITETARLLGIARRTVQYRLREYEGLHGRRSSRGLRGTAQACAHVGSR